ncbi:TCR/Tet family MFS transporter [Dyadobacter frigoris]|uniref:TCR/Tet family MFS transporter n=1 Tax=Dyadobacter frigoris TaxID=2576211 RepID=A0A4U6D8X7_9BACT|nr:TCR/Tet family MFS transporter [Dyadobacter frigoris]TKT93960.1 TCR/Tet family MFS transporter [Dyadobacter frigoris]GLU50822.1 tetracycline resistance MFS efflux pump [Dyadobacter frigoris]
MTSKKSPAIGFIFVTLLIDVIGLGIIIPVMPKLISELVGGSLSDAARYGGWILFSYSFVQFICAPIVGGLSDQFGRRPVLLASLLGFALDYMFLAYAPSIGWLFVGRIIAGIMGASFTTGAAYIADVSTPEKRAQNFGLIGAAFGLGFIIGPVLGGLLGQYGSRVPFLAAGGLSLVNWIYGYFILPESLKPENRRKFSWDRANPAGALKNLQRHPVISGLIVSLALLYIANHAIQSNWSYYTMEKFHWDAKIIGYSLGAMGLLGAIVQGGLIRLIIPKIGQKRGVYIGLFLYSVGFVLFAFAAETWMMFAFMVPYILGGIAGPSLQGLISTQVPANEQGELQGAMTSLMSLTSIIGPPLMSNLFYFFTKPTAPVYFPGAPMLIAAVLTLVSAYLARKSLKKNF